MEKKDKASLIVRHMYDNDPFSQWLGIKVLHTSPGSCRLGMTVRDEMTNGFGVAHGGIAYSLADSALAFAANGYGIKSMSIDTQINHLRPLRSGDEIFAEVEELNITRRTALYLIKISIGKDGKTAAIFKGTVFRTGEEWNIAGE